MTIASFTITLIIGALIGAAVVGFLLLKAIGAGFSR